jgi:hypothetical protein
MNTPYVADAHVGLRAGQSKHTSWTRWEGGTVRREKQSQTRQWRAEEVKGVRTQEAKAAVHPFIHPKQTRVETEDASHPKCKYTRHVHTTSEFVSLFFVCVLTWFSGLVFMRLKAATLSSAVTYLDISALQVPWKLEKRLPTR